MKTETDVLELYLSLFKGREDCFGQQHESSYCPVHRPLDAFYLHQHLSGDVTYGVYVLSKESSCYFFCVDIDIPKAELKITDFANRTAKYDYLGQHLRDTIHTLTVTLGIPQEALLLEETGGRGYHIWIFLRDAIVGDSAVAFGRILKNYLRFEIEFFPKQGQLTGKKFGNLIKLPLGIHRKYSVRSVFFRLSDGEPRYCEGLECNLEFLTRVVPADSAVVLEIVRTHPASVVTTRSVEYWSTERELQRPLFRGDLKTLVTRCTAIQCLRAKAEAGQHLTRAEAFHFANILVSAEQGQDYVVETMRASYGGEYDEQKTLTEIEKIRPLFPTSCATLVEQGICLEYCREGIRKRNTDPLLTSTTPCGVWLKRLQGAPSSGSEDLVMRIGETSNVRRSFFQLKTYHEHEDSLFFDPFDFEQYEKDFASNCEIIAGVLRERLMPPFAGYLDVEIPKKLDTDYHLVYRKMSYSTVHDQVPIQAVFNIVAPLIERVFLDCSYGYRWNSDEHNPNRIFNDWREAYPRFRGQMLAALRGNPNGFHICCDIKGYYDHVDHAMLSVQLRSIIGDGYVLKFINDVVAMYRHDHREAKGLPQGPAYARLLANLFLNDLDKFATRHTAKYLRYVDDLFLFYDSKENANRGLQEVVKYLHNLGLELSEADDKKPTITPNTDESRVRRSLDKIQYGILEGTRQLKHLDQSGVSDFSDAVERHSASPATLDDLLKLNDYMPSLLYVVTEESLVPHPLRGKVWAIVKYLIEHRWFFPKRLKMVFCRLLDLSPSDEELAELYESMEPAHKVYFILSIYGNWLASERNRDLLERVTGKAVRDGCAFVRGFGIAIGIRLGLRDRFGLTSESYILELLRESSYFAPGKWVSGIAYLSLCDERESVRKLVNPDSISFLKALLLDNLGGEIQTYLDGKYISNIIDGADATLLPTVCTLIVSTNSKSDLLDKLLEVAASHPALKPSVVAMLGTKLFDSLAGAGRARIENLKMLYQDNVKDPEIKRILQTGLLRISDECLPDIDGIDFAKCHQQLGRYNECFLFRYTGQLTDYDCLELIPLSRLRQYISSDIESLKNVFEDLSEKNILPPLKFIYDSGREEVNIQLRLIQAMKPVSTDDFHLDQTSILRALRLVVQVYKKASYFRRMLGRAPFIHADNLLVSETDTSVVFQTVGMSLCSPYLIDGTAIGDEEEDIPRMVGMLLARLLVGDSGKVQAFIKAPHTGVESFLALFIKNMSSKTTAKFYSCSRFEYMIDELVAASEHGEQQIAALYMRERLKGAMFRRNGQRVTWYGLASTVAEHISHLREICCKESIKQFAYRNRFALSPFSKSQPHWVSKQLFNIAMNRGIGPTGSDIDQTYAAIVEYLLLYSAVSIETLSLYRCVQRVTSRDRLPLALTKTLGSIRVSAAEYEETFDLSELTAIRTASHVESVCETVQEVGELSLRQMMLHILLSFDVRVTENRVNISGDGIIPSSVFRPLAHACMVRIPRIEENIRMVVIAILEALQNNDIIVLPNVTIDLREDLIVLADDFKRFRKHLRIRRCSGGVSGKRYFPPDVRCESSFRKTIMAKEAALPGSPLTSKLPASQYHGSWDMQGKAVVNLIVPDDGLNALLSDLKAGKFFGIKLTYLYSGKMMLFYDVLIMLVIFAFLAFCEYEKELFKDHAVWSAILNCGSKIFVTAFVGFCGKMVFWDIGHWIPGLGAWIKGFRETNDRGIDSPK